ncbi:hypothetical protein BDV11DRAFT_205399 [Aspergillus similis]
MFVLSARKRRKKDKSRRPWQPTRMGRWLDAGGSTRPNGPETSHGYLTPFHIWHLFERVTAPAREGRIGPKSSSPGRIPLPDKVFTNSAGMLQRGGTGSESQPFLLAASDYLQDIRPSQARSWGGHVVAFECMPVNRLNTRVLEMVIITKENCDFDSDH